MLTFEIGSSDTRSGEIRPWYAFDGFILVRKHKIARGREWLCRDIRESMDRTVQETLISNRLLRLQAFPRYLSCSVTTVNQERATQAQQKILSIAISEVRH